MTEETNQDEIYNIYVSDNNNIYLNYNTFILEDTYKNSKTYRNNTKNTIDF